MKVLFDECVPRKLRVSLPGHVIQTTQEANCAGLKNGELLKKASENFDVMITVDRNMGYQQNLKTLPIPLIVLHSKSNKLADLKKLSPEIQTLLKSDLKNQLYHLGV